MYRQSLSLRHLFILLGISAKFFCTFFCYSSLKYFKPRFMSLTSPHPLWTSAGSSPANIAMATVQAQMLSGRFRTGSLCRHWSQNKSGLCLLPATHLDVVEDIPHILRDCDALDETRLALQEFTKKFCESIPHPIANLILSQTDLSSPTFCQFLLDCSSLPCIIRASQEYDRDSVYHYTFAVTRTWIYSLHRERMKLLGRWKIL